MKVCICSAAKKAVQAKALQFKGLSQLETELKTDVLGWERGGEDSEYIFSKLNKILDDKESLG